MHYLNVLVVSSETRPAKIIRFFTKSQYNHTSISLDDNYNEFYSFARKKAFSPLDAGFVKEKASYYSLGKNKDVNVKLFKVPIEDNKMVELKKRLVEIENDKEYIYNFISAILYPFHLSHPTYKAYYCSEFVAEVLNKYTNISLDRESSKYSPKDIELLLNDYLWYEGKISKLTSIKKDKDSFYDKVPLKMVFNSFIMLITSLITRHFKF